MDRLTAIKDLFNQFPTLVETEALVETETLGESL